MWPSQLTRYLSVRSQLNELKFFVRHRRINTRYLVRQAADQAFCLARLLLIPNEACVFQSMRWDPLRVRDDRTGVDLTIGILERWCFHFTLLPNSKLLSTTASL